MFGKKPNIEKPTAYLLLQADMQENGMYREVNIRMIDEGFNRQLLNNRAMYISIQKGCTSCKVFDGDNRVIYEYGVG